MIGVLSSISHLAVSSHLSFLGFCVSCLLIPTHSERLALRPLPFSVLSHDSLNVHCEFSLKSLSKGDVWRHVQKITKNCQSIHLACSVVLMPQCGFLLSFWHELGACFGNRSGLSSFYWGLSVVLVSLKAGKAFPRVTTKIVNLQSLQEGKPDLISVWGISQAAQLQTMPPVHGNFPLSPNWAHQGMAWAAVEPLTLGTQVVIQWYHGSWT